MTEPLILDPARAGAYQRLVADWKQRAEKLEAERDAARADVDWILEAIKGDRFKDDVGQTAEDYVRYSLGTTGRLYHVEGYTAVVEEAAEAYAVLRDLVSTYMADGDVGSVVRRAEDLTGGQQNG